MVTFPNPVTDKFNIRFVNEYDIITAVTIGIYNSKGQLVLSQITTSNAGQNTIALNLLSFKKDTYFIQLKLGDKPLFSGKFIKL